MEIVYNLIVLLHFIGMACVVGGFLANAKAPSIVPAMWHGALTQLVSGMILAGMASAKVGHSGDVNHMKIGIKLIITLAVVICFMLGRKGDATKGRQMAIIGSALAIVNVAVAVFI